MNEEEIVYLGARFWVERREDGRWSAYYPGGKDRVAVLGESRESVIEAVQEHLDRWGLPEE